MPRPPACRPPSCTSRRRPRATAPTVSASNCMNGESGPAPASRSGTPSRRGSCDRVSAGVEVLGDIAGERGGQVVAEREPLLVVVLEREHALVRPVLVGQEFAERLGIFDERRLHRLEAVELVGRPDRSSMRSVAAIRRVRSTKPRGRRAFSRVVGFGRHGSHRGWTLPRGIARAPRSSKHRPRGECRPPSSPSPRWPRQGDNHKQSNW